MKILMALLIASTVSSMAVAQQESFDDCVKTVQGLPKIRVSPGIIEELVLKRSLPDASDTKSIKNSVVKIAAMIDQTGAVICAGGAEGDAALYPRSVEAAKRWTFRPYTLNEQPLLVESAFYFHFNKGKVKGKFCAECK